MGKSKRRKGTAHDVTAFPSVASPRQQQLPKASLRADTTSSSTPGTDDVFSPWQRHLQGKLRHGATGNSGSTYHLPTITRGPEALRQTCHNGSSPAQRTPANQTAVSKIAYLSEIATWAATNKIPSLGAFYGERLGSACQSAGIPSPVLNSQCGRCESVLLPEVNCSVRVSCNKRKKKTWREGKGVQAIATGNTVMQRCHHCKYRNRKPGAPKDYVKTKLAEAVARAQMKAAASSSCPTITGDPITPVHTQGLMKASAEGALSVTPAGSQPAVLTSHSVLQVDQSVSSGCKKKKRKGWTGLKAISTSLQSRELPTPERLGFALDFTSPLNSRPPSERHWSFEVALPSLLQIARCRGSLWLKEEFERFAKVKRFTNGMLRVAQERLNDNPRAD